MSGPVYPAPGTAPFPVSQSSPAAGAAPVNEILRNFPFGALGYYRSSHRCALVNSQAGPSRLLELQNPTTNLVIPVWCKMQIMQTGAHTAAIEDSLDLFKVTGFTALDNTNVVTPGSSRMRTSNMAAAPGGAAVRGVTVAGAAAGMTGGTLTKDGNPLKQVPIWFYAAQPTSGGVPFAAGETFDFEHPTTHPLVLEQNEGLLVESRVAFGVAGAASVYLEIGWAEISAANFTN